MAGSAIKVLIVLSLTAISIVIGASVSHFTFDAVYTTCFRENGISQADVESNLFLKTTHGLLQNERVFDSLLQCVESKKETLMKSPDAVEWYTGHTFDRNQAQSILRPMVDVYTPDSICLKRWAQQFTGCLSHLSEALYDARPSVNHLNKDSLCSITTHVYEQCMFIYAVEFDSRCSADDRLLLWNVASFYSGFCLKSQHTLQEFENPGIVQSLPDIDLGEAAQHTQLVGCFMTIGQDVTTAMSGISENPSDPLGPVITAMTKVCSSRGTMLTCIKNVHETSNLEIDRTIFKVAHPVHIEELVNYVCSNIDVIADNGICLLYQASKLEESAPTKCTELQTNLATLSSKMPDIPFPGDGADTEEAIDTAIQTVCNALGPLPDCLQSVGNSCGNNAGVMLHKIGSIIEGNCGSGSEKLGQPFSIMLISTIITLMYL